MNAFYKIGLPILVIFITGLYVAYKFIPAFSLTIQHLNSLTPFHDLFHLEEIFPYWLSKGTFKITLLFLPALLFLLLFIIAGRLYYQYSLRYKIYIKYREIYQISSQLNKLDLTDLEQEIVRLTDLYQDWGQQASVPLSHTPTFCSLCLHLDYILERLEARRLKLIDESAADLAKLEETVVFFQMQEIEKTLNKLVEQLQNQAITEPQTESSLCVETRDNESDLSLEQHQVASVSQESVTQVEEQPEPDLETEITHPPLPAPAEHRTSFFKHYISKIPHPRFIHKKKLDSSIDKTIEDQESTPLLSSSEPPSALMKEVKPVEQLDAINDSKYQKAQIIVRKHMLAGMALSAVPVPVIDVAALTSTQLNLLNTLSNYYEVEFNKERGKSLLVALLSGSLPTTLLMWLSSLTKAVPGIGSLGGGMAMSAVAGSVIYATGQVFIKHFEAGGQLNNFDGEQQQAYFRQALKDGLAVPGAEAGK